jgi:hypothetical protein
MVEAQQPIVRVDDHSERIEANRVGFGTRMGVLVKPCACQPSQASALAELQPRQRLVLGTKAPTATVRASCLDLDEYEDPSVECDDVDLAVACSDVASDDHKSKAPEVTDREILAELA